MYNPQFCVHWQPIVEDHMAKTTKMSKKIILKENSFEWDSGYSDGWYHERKQPKIGKFPDFKFYDFFTDMGFLAVNYSRKVIGFNKKAIKAAKRP